MSVERTRILEMLESGKVSAEQAIELLNALNGVEPAVRVDEVQTLPPDLPRPGSGWTYLVAVGAVVMAVGAPFVVLGLANRVAIFWALLCGWMPFLAGLAVLTLGFWARDARWLHLRVSRRGGKFRSLGLSLPLPLALAAWTLGVLRSRTHWLQGTGIDEAILALQEGLGDKDGQPIYLDVSNDGGGEHIQVYFG